MWGRVKKPTDTQAGEHGPCPFPLVGGNVFLRADLTRLCLVDFSAGVVQGGALSSICTQILTMVSQEQSKVLWIPACPP